MLQTARVIALHQNGEAEVSIKRETACGHDCTSCGACGAQARPIVATAKNSIGAKVGDNVTIETKTSRVLGIAVVVYVVPLVLFFLFYGLCMHLWNSENIAIAGALVGLVCGLAAAFILNRYEAKRRTNCTIVKVID